MFHDDLDFIIFVIYWNIWFQYMESPSIDEANELHHISIIELIAEALDLNKVYNCPEGPDVSRGIPAHLKMGLRAAENRRSNRIVSSSICRVCTNMANAFDDNILIC